MDPAAPEPLEIGKMAAARASDASTLQRYLSSLSHERGIDIPGRLVRSNEVSGNLAKPLLAMLSLRRDIGMVKFQISLFFNWLLVEACRKRNFV